MSGNVYGILNPLSTISNINCYGSSGNIYQTSMSFGTILKSQMVNQIKQEIYNRFQVEVGGDGDDFKLYIPSETLYQMNTNSTLKEKVFHMLEKYSGEEFKNSIMGEESAIKNCTLTFDEEGDMTATLKTGTEKQSTTDQSTTLLYQKLLMQQAALMPYQTNLYTGYNTMYGLNGINYVNTMQNSLFSSIFRGLY